MSASKALYFPNRPLIVIIIPLLPSRYQQASLREQRFCLPIPSINGTAWQFQKSLRFNLSTGGTFININTRHFMSKSCSPAALQDNSGCCDNFTPGSYAAQIATKLFLSRQPVRAICTLSVYAAGSSHLFPSLPAGKCYTPCWRMNLGFDYYARNFDMTKTGQRIGIKIIFHRIPFCRPSPENFMG